jgi:hypothetical protein
MSRQSLRVVPVFSPDDQAWLRMNRIVVPDFWSGHTLAPTTGDALRIAGRQFMIQGRVWEHDGEGAVLRLFVGDAHAPSDTVFG